MPGEAGALRETARAKINLALHVRERMADGYHRIETLFAFAGHGDELNAEPAPGLGLAIDGPFAGALDAGPDNLVLRAAATLRDAFGIAAGAALRLTKHLPVASGIGGGSADAAAALRLLARLWGLPADDGRLAEIARSLGADVPACLLSETCAGEGRGERLTPVPSGALAGRPLLLVNPGVAVPTGPVFAGWDGVDRGPLRLSGPLALDPGWRNDLEPSARAIAPAIGDVLSALAAEEGAQFVRMSGSGATCFALFESAAARDRAAAAIAAAHPGWWIMASALR